MFLDHHMIYNEEYEEFCTTVDFDASPRIYDVFFYTKIINGNNPVVHKSVNVKVSYYDINPCDGEQLYYVEIPGSDVKYFIKYFPKKPGEVQKINLVDDITPLSTNVKQCPLDRIRVYNY